MRRLNKRGGKLSGKLGIKKPRTRGAKGKGSMENVAGKKDGCVRLEA